LGVSVDVQSAVAAADDLDAGGPCLDGVGLDGGCHDLIDRDDALVSELVGCLQA
jgi:hypothetical protein